MPGLRRVVQKLRKHSANGILLKALRVYAAQMMKRLMASLFCVQATHVDVETLLQLSVTSDMNVQDTFC